MALRTTAVLGQTAIGIQWGILALRMRCALLFSYTFLESLQTDPLQNNPTRQHVIGGQVALQLANVQPHNSHTSLSSFELCVLYGGLGNLFGRPYCYFVPSSSSSSDINKLVIAIALATTATT